MQRGKGQSPDCNQKPETAITTSTRPSDRYLPDIRHDPAALDGGMADAHPSHGVRAAGPGMRKIPAVGKHGPQVAIDLFPQRRQASADQPVASHPPDPVAQMRKPLHRDRYAVIRRACGRDDDPVERQQLLRIHRNLVPQDIDEPQSARQILKRRLEDRQRLFDDQHPPHANIAAAFVSAVKRCLRQSLAQCRAMVEQHQQIRLALPADISERHRLVFQHPGQKLRLAKQLRNEARVSTPLPLFETLAFSCCLRRENGRCGPTGGRRVLIEGAAHIVGPDADLDGKEGKIATCMIACRGGGPAAILLHRKGLRSGEFQRPRRSVEIAADPRLKLPGGVEPDANAGACLIEARAGSMMAL